jgi:hypothetical protein
LAGTSTALGLAALVVGLAFLARTPGPERDPALLHVEVMHDSMLPARIEAGTFSGPPAGPPKLLSSIDSQLEESMTSWAYAHGRYRITVHRLEQPLDLPHNVQVLGLDGARVTVFESTNLTFLTWQDDGAHTYLVVGDAPIARLDEVGRWFRAGAGRAPRRAPQNSAPPAAGPAPR